MVEWHNTTNVSKGAWVNIVNGPRPHPITVKGCGEVLIDPFLMKISRPYLFAIGGGEAIAIKRQDDSIDFYAPPAIEEKEEQL